MKKSIGKFKVFKSSKKNSSGKLIKAVLKLANLYYANKNVGTFPQVAVFSFDHIGISINIEGRYEGKKLDAVFEFLEEFGFLPERKTALDIGANIGNHSLFFANTFSEVISFEPNPKTFELLELNCRNKNISVHNLGASEKNSRLKFAIYYSNIGGSKVLDGGSAIAPKNGELIDVDLIRIDEFLLDYQSISLIKIDVEGHEEKALLGAQNLIDQSSPVILFEQNAADISGGTSPSIKLLESLGYKMFVGTGNFYFGESSVGKLFTHFLQGVFGECYKFEQSKFFEKRFYDMIIAVKA